MTGLYSLLHFLVDGVCAYAMFGYFSQESGWYLNILLYNFCAFAMQMPLGVLLDVWNKRRRGEGATAFRRAGDEMPAFCFAVSGVVLTLVGALLHPIVLGLGNALFHLGGGVGTIYEDEKRGWRGRGLGVFVAPGALGLYIGTQLGNRAFGYVGLAVMAGIMLLLCVGGVYLLFADGRRLFRSGKNNAGAQDRVVQVASENVAPQGCLSLLIGCITVVVLRSYIGMAVSFPWKTTLLAGTISVLAVVFGKIAGGFVAAQWGVRRTMTVSLVLAALTFLLSDAMPVGILAQFLFNMTMPVTLYLLVQRKKDMPGFGFGALTFALFLGILPVYLDIPIPLTGKIIGCVGSLVSLAVLWWCIRKED